MSGGYDYEKLLRRAILHMPEKKVSGERFQMPKLELFYEGKTTVFRNFVDVCEKLNRDPKELLAYLLKELGTAGSISGRRAIFKGRVLHTNIEEKMRWYVDSYVLCSECHLPDTKLYREGRTLMLKCEACGAVRPAKLIKTKPSEPAIAVGKEYAVTVEDISPRGDGIARIGRYIIYIPKVKKGSHVRIKILKISQDAAFARLV